MSLNHDPKLTLLVSIGFKPEFVSTKHLLSSLKLNVGAHRLVGNMSYCASVIAAAPKRRKSGTQGRKFFPQNSTGKSFQAIHDFSYPPARIELNKKMHVIGHNFQGVNCHLKLAGFLAEKRLKPPLHLISKHTA